jgi:hypothetical protein
MWVEDVGQFAGAFPGFADVGLDGTGLTGVFFGGAGDSVGAFEFATDDLRFE